jgi:hypothetical protein
MEWNKILSDVIGVLVVALIPYFGILIGKMINSLIASIKAPAIRALAYDAVNWAADKFGPDGAGKDKLAAAVAFLVKKTGISAERAEVLIRSAYVNLTDSFPKETPATPAI